MGNFSLLAELLSRGVGRYEDMSSGCYPGSAWDLRMKKRSKSLVYEFEHFPFDLSSDRTPEVEKVEMQSSLLDILFP